MSNVIEQLAPHPVTHELGENGCCKNPRAWEMEMMHQVWAAGLHDALETKWKLESQRKRKPETNRDRIQAMTDEEMANELSKVICPNVSEECCHTNCKECWLDWLRSPVEESEK